MAGSATLDDGTTLRVKGKQRVPRGRRLQLRLPGGGGIGNPLLRDLDRVAADVAAGIVTVEAAVEQYGVVVSPDATIDVAATCAERERRKASRRRRSVSPRTLVQGIR